MKFHFRAFRLYFLNLKYILNHRELANFSDALEKRMEVMVQEQNETIENQKAKIEALEAEVDLLKNRGGADINQVRTSNTTPATSVSLSI